MVVYALVWCGHWNWTSADTLEGWIVCSALCRFRKRHLGCYSLDAYKARGKSSSSNRKSGSSFNIGSPLTTGLRRDSPFFDITIHRATHLPTTLYWSHRGPPATLWSLSVLCLFATKSYQPQKSQQYSNGQEHYRTITTSAMCVISARFERWSLYCQTQHCRSCPQTVSLSFL